jgi:hypothetical protein
MKPLKYILNSPWTLIGIIAALVSGPKCVRFMGDAIVFNVRSFWWAQFVPGMGRGIRGITNGNAISLGPLEEPNDLAHELVHVRQNMKEPFVCAFTSTIEAMKHGHGLRNKYEKEAYETTGSVYRGGK